LEAEPKDMRNALLTAVSHNNINLIQILLNSGADINAPGQMGETVLMASIL
jgi:ankyrin repeat protein